MRRPRYLSALYCSVLLLTGSLVGAAAGAEESYRDIEDLMSAEEFSAAGLDRLDAEQLRALNAWLKRYGDPDTEVLRTQIEAADQETEVLRTQIEEVVRENEELKQERQQETAVLQTQVEQVVRENEELKQEREQAANPVFHSRITGNFNGWTGNTVFRLENGQVWQQRLRSRYAHHGDNPEVRIEKNYMGFFKMTVIDNGRTVGVKRIR